MAILIIRIFEDHTKQLFHFDDQGVLATNNSIQSFHELTDIHDSKLIILLPGTHVHMFKVNLPTMSASELQQAVPNSLEEQLSEDISELYFTIGEADDNKNRSVTVIRRTYWSQLIDELKQAGLTPDVIIPDYLALPLAAHSWSVYVDTETVLVRLAAQAGFSCDPNLINQLLSLTLNDTTTEIPEHVHIYIASTATPPKLELAAAANTQHRDFETLVTPLELLQNPPFNMLQRQFRKKHKKTQQRSYWYWCGMSFASLVAILFIGQIALYTDFKIKIHSLNKQLISTYQKIVPGVTELDNAKFRTQKLLKQYELAPNPFMQILQRIGHVKLQNKSINISTLNYIKDKITLVISANTNNELNQFNQQLTHAGLKINSNQTNIANKQITETITVEVL